MNISLRLPTSLLESPKGPAVGHLRSGGLALEVRGDEIASYQLKHGDLQAVCAQLWAIAGKPTRVDSTEKARDKSVDSRGRPPYPFGSKEHARELLARSMTASEIETYLDQFAD